MTTTLTAGGVEIEQDPGAFGFLRESSSAERDAVLRERLDEDGYLFLPGFLDREAVRGVRRLIAERLAAEGLLDAAQPVESAVAAPGADVAFRPDLVSEGPARAALEAVIYGPEMMALAGRMLGGEAAHFDYTWLRAVAPGRGTYPHCDVVFMGRGTHDLLTAWVPLGDVPLSVGGLIVVEGSHRDETLREGYCRHDVDTFCANDPGRHPMAAAGLPAADGSLGAPMRTVRAGLGGRLLTAREFRMGDVLLFGPYLVHGSLDNGSREIRMSSDSRYQRAGEPMDERWVGIEPMGHGEEAARGLIC